MENNASLVPVSPRVVAPVTPAPASNGSQGYQGKKDGGGPEAGRYRLVIEEGPSAGSFVYKTMDRLTGEVVKQYPREKVVEMQASPDYGAGTVIDTAI